MTTIFKLVDTLIGVFKTMFIVAITLLLLKIPMLISSGFKRAIEWIRS